jgi:hypothetical protein
MGEFSVCKLLIDLGEDANYIPNCWYEDRSHLKSTPTCMLKFYSSVIRVALLNAVVMKFQDKVQEGLDTIRLLSSKVEVEPDELRFYRGPREGFILLQQYIDPQYYEKSLEERVTVLGARYLVPRYYLDTYLLRLPRYLPDLGPIIQVSTCLFGQISGVSA